MIIETIDETGLSEFGIFHQIRKQLSRGCFIQTEFDDLLDPVGIAVLAIPRFQFDLGFDGTGVGFFAAHAVGVDVPCHRFFEKMSH